MGIGPNLERVINNYNGSLNNYIIIILLYINIYIVNYVDKLKAVNLKRENRDREKITLKMKIVEPCNSIISEIPILTAPSHIAI